MDDNDRVYVLRSVERVKTTPETARIRRARIWLKYDDKEMGFTATGRNDGKAIMNAVETAWEAILHLDD